MRIKKLLPLLACLICILSFSGCVRYSYSITIKEDGHADVVKLAAVNQLLVSASPDILTDLGISDADIADYESKGYSVTPYSSDGYTGYTISENDIELSALEQQKTMKSNRDLSIANGDTASQPYAWEMQNDTLSISFDVESAYGLNAYRNYYSMIRSNGGFLQVSFTLPKAPSTSNAAVVSDDGCTLTWDLLSMSAGESLEITYSFPSEPEVASTPAPDNPSSTPPSHSVSPTLTPTESTIIPLTDDPVNVQKSNDVPIFLIVLLAVGALLLVLLLVLLLRMRKSRVSPAEAERKRQIALSNALREYHKLMAEGIITQEDFLKKKLQLLETDGHISNSQE